MHPQLINNEHAHIASYDFLFFIAWTMGGLLYYHAVKKENLNLETMLSILCGCAIGAMIGSFVLNLILFGYEELFLKLQNLDFKGMSVIGGISGGFIGVEIAKKMVGHEENTGDFFVLSILIGHSIGRLGCLLGGCCFGTHCALPWAIVYPMNSPAYFYQLNQGLIGIDSLTSIPVHPAPIYEIIFNISLLVIFFTNKSWFHVKGALFRSYIVAYCSFRLLIEFVRADTGMIIFMGLKPIQINLALAAIYFSWWLWKNNKERMKIPEN